MCAAPAALVAAGALLHPPPGPPPARRTARSRGAAGRSPSPEGDGAGPRSSVPAGPASAASRFLMRSPLLPVAVKPPQQYGDHLGVRSHQAGGAGRGRSPAPSCLPARPRPESGQREGPARAERPPGSEEEGIERHMLVEEIAVGSLTDQHPLRGHQMKTLVRKTGESQRGPAQTAGQDEREGDRDGTEEVGGWAGNTAIHADLLRDCAPGGPLLARRMTTASTCGRRPPGVYFPRHGCTREETPSRRSPGSPLI